MKIKKTMLGALDAMALRLGYHKPRRAYQDSRFPEDQYSLISATNQYAEINNTIEIGCNLGRLAQAISADGKFAVGLDIRDHWFCRDNGNSVLGVYPINMQSIQVLPDVDAYLLLSVHHQWVKSGGDDYARNLVMTLFKKAGICMYIEFAALASKYGYDQGACFVDNDRDSVVKYALNWLSDCGIDDSTFLGETREKQSVEPHRFMFMLNR